MALNVTMSGNSSSAKTYSLKVNSARISYDRSPLVAPMPGGVDPIILDLGQFRVKIVLEGTVPVSGTESDGTNDIPSKVELEDLLTNPLWYAANITFVIGGDSYIAKIASCAFSLEASKEEWWTFNMALHSKKKVAE
jgi:hypothetical protein